MSHFLLTKELLQTLQATAASSLPGEVRVVNISSFGYSMAPKEGIAFDDISLKSSKGSLWTLYGQSKLANILHAQEVARRYGTGDHPILSISVDPGMVKT
jgi:NAD(P)-dependent dehydrogenase (short-subunit alcohol dehydrogenase family)